MTREFWDGTQWVPQYRANFSYYNNDDSTLTFWSIWDDANSEWRNTYLQTSIYGTDRKLLHETTDIWTGPNNQTGNYNDYSRRNNSYAVMSVSGTNYVFLKTELAEDWNYNTQHWDTSEYRSSTPNTSGLVNTTVEQLSLGGHLQNTHKYQYFYDGQRRRTQQWTYTWNNGQWEEDFSIVWMFAIGKDRIEQTQVRGYDASNKTFTLPQLKTDNIYNSNDQIDSAITYEWDDQNSVYVEASLYEANYDNKDRLVEELFKNYNASTKQWEVLNRATYVYSDKVSVSDLAETRVSVYPNPATDVLRVDGADVKEAHLYSSRGNHVMTEKVEMGTQMELNVSELPGGYYILQLVLEDGRSMTEKVLLNAR